MLSFQKVFTTACCIFLLLSSGADAASSTKKDDKRKKKKVIPKGVVQKVGALADTGDLKAKTATKIELQKRLNHREKKEVAKAELEAYKKKRRDGFDEVGNTNEAVMLRNYRLRNKKKQGLLRKKTSLLVTGPFPRCVPRGIRSKFSNLDLYRFGQLEEDSNSL